MKILVPPKFRVLREEAGCIACQVCINQCSFDAHYYDAEDDLVESCEENCVARRRPG